MCVKNLYQSILDNINFVRNNKLLNDEKLENYAKHNVHSILQYCLMRNTSGLITIPEFKVKLKKPIDKFAVDPRFGKKKERYRKHIKVDVGHLENAEIVGFGEVFTPDEIHGVLDSKDLEKEWITPRHKIEHLIMHNRHKFFVVINLMNKIPPWKGAKKRSRDGWKRLWKDFIEKICKGQGGGSAHNYERRNERGH